jgi:flagellar L-ring protein precursor FlgH
MPDRGGTVQGRGVACARGAALAAWRVDLRSRSLIVAVAAVLAGCAAPRHQVIVEGQTTARPAPVAHAATPTGGIYQPAAFRPLFEDRKPRFVGDLLTISLNERLNASQKANSSAERNGDFEVSLPGVKGVFGKKINPLDAKASTANSFDGKGATESSNLFTGTITVTVVEVLANGNLRVAGEKQIGIRQNSEVLRFSGVIDPAQIQPGNVVSSTQVADARLDYRGGGYIEEAQIQGWLARFFNSISPF